MGLSKSAMKHSTNIPSDKPFIIGMWLLGLLYVSMIIMLVVADFLYLSKSPVGKTGLISHNGGVVSLDWLKDQSSNTLTITAVSGEKETFSINREDEFAIIDGRETLVQKKDSVIVENGDTVRKGARLTMAELSGTDALMNVFYSPEIRYSTVISLLSCSLSAIMSLWVAIPIGYIMSRFEFPGKKMVDGILDIPIVLPPLVIGISLLALFNFAPFSWMSQWVVFEIPAIILAQFMVACAFAVRTLRVTFDRIPVRYENVAMTLGCNRAQAFFSVILPQARYGITAALTLAWARALGEFGPILVFAGSTSFRTEVLPTSVFLELQAGSLKGALVISLLMIVIASVVLIIARMLGMREESK